MSKVSTNSNVLLNDDELMEIFAEIEANFEKQTTLERNKKIEQEIDTSINSLVSEAVKHFAKRFRKGYSKDFDERYFYSKSEVEKFLKLNKNPQVKIREKYDEIEPNRIYCYIAYRTN